MSFTQGRQVLTLLTPHYKERQGKTFRWGSQSSHGSEADQPAHPAVLPTEGRPKTTSGQAQVQRLVLSELQGRKLVSEKRYCPRPASKAEILTWSESSVTRSPSFVIPSSFRSFRWGHRARQKALATCSVSRLWSAGSLRQLCWSSFSRKNTCSPNKRDF